MIQFRCWYCSRLLFRPEADAGVRFTCGCGQPAKVPRRSGGSSRVRTPGDWAAEILVYGGVGAAAGFVVGLVFVRRLFVFVGGNGLDIVVATTVLGLVLGTAYGESGLNLIGQYLRDREDARRLK